ncbi:MAG: glycosyltransferase family 2 protein [Proteobacteria bacterium]|nr:glycosyltransferase family 2 protein [Pseudomonadota bacterium]
MSHPWTSYGAQLNFALSQASYDWVFFTDQDELVSPELAQSILDATQHDMHHSVYMIERRNLLFNKWLRFGGAVEHNPRLVFRPQVRYCDAQHTHLCGKFAKDKMKGPVLHDMAPSLIAWWQRSIRLAAIEAKNDYWQGVRFSRIKTSFFWWKFVRRYIFKLGFLDGWAGFYMAMQRSLYILVYQASLFELERGMDNVAESVERFR